MIIAISIYLLIAIYWLSRAGEYHVTITEDSFIKDESCDVPYFVIPSSKHKLILPKFANELNIIMFFDWEIKKNNDIYIYKKNPIKRFNIIINGLKKWNQL